MGGYGPLERPIDLPYQTDVSTNVSGVWSAPHAPRPMLLPPAAPGKTDLTTWRDGMPVVPALADNRSSPEQLDNMTMETQNGPR